MQNTRIGEFEVHRIAEYEGPFIAPETFFPDFDPRRSRSNPDHPGAEADRPGDRQPPLQLPQLHRQDRASHDPDRFLPRQRQGAPDPAAIPSAAHSYIADLARVGVERRGCRLCDVHSSALGPCRLEHPARKRALGPDLSQCALCHGAPRVRPLGGGAQNGEDSPIASPSRTACCRWCAPGNRCWSTTTMRSRTGCGSKAPPATRPAMS